MAIWAPRPPLAPVSKTDFPSRESRVCCKTLGSIVVELPWLELISSSTTPLVLESTLRSMFVRPALVLGTMLLRNESDSQKWFSPSTISSNTAISNARNDRFLIFLLCERRVISVSVDPWKGAKVEILLQDGNRFCVFETRVLDSSFEFVVVDLDFIPNRTSRIFFDFSSFFILGHLTKRQLDTTKLRKLRYFILFLSLRIHDHC